MDQQSNMPDSDYEKQVDAVTPEQKKKPLSNFFSRNKYLLLTVLGLLVVILIGVQTYLVTSLGKVSTKVQDSLSPSPVPSIHVATSIPTSPPQPISDVIEYEIPEGWIQSEDEYGVDLRSPDHPDPKTYMGIYGGPDGARIDLFLSRKDPEKTLEEMVNEEPDFYFSNEPKEVTIGGKKGYNRFSIWEALIDQYKFEVGEYILIINFRCYENCASKEELEQKSVYKDERDFFLDSIVFKDSQ
jgi:hypothetical protein